MKKINKILFINSKKNFYSEKIFQLFKRNCNKIIKVNSKSKIQKILDSNLKFDFIIIYRSRVILKKKHLEKGIYGSINFHPATHKYPGMGGINYAIYNKNSSFGVTCHLINEKIDNGKILNVKNFRLNKKDDLEKNLKKIYAFQYLQAKWLVKNITKNKNFALNFKSKFRWAKVYYSKRKLDKFYNLNFEEIKKKKINVKLYLRATIYKNFLPYIARKNYLK